MYHFVFLYEFVQYLKFLSRNDTHEQKMYAKIMLQKICPNNANTASIKTLDSDLLKARKASVI
jgi:hypothetical protein